MRELNIADSLAMTDVRMSARAVLNSVEEMNFAFWSAQKEEVAYFWEEADNLISCFLTSNPCEYILLRQITILNRKGNTSPPRL